MQSLKSLVVSSRAELEHHIVYHNYPSVFCLVSRCILYKSMLFLNDSEIPSKPNVMGMFWHDTTYLWLKDFLTFKSLDLPLNGGLYFLLTKEINFIDDMFLFSPSSYDNRYTKTKTTTTDTWGIYDVEHCPNHNSTTWFGVCNVILFLYPFTFY